MQDAGGNSTPQGPVGGDGARGTDHAEAGDSKSDHIDAIGMLVCDPVGQLLAVNDDWRKITGVYGELPENATGLDALILEEDREKVMREFLHAAGKRVEYASDARFVRPDGTIRNLRLQGIPFFDGNGALQGFFGTLTDLTEMHEALCENRRNAERYRSLIDNAPVGQITSDLDGTIRDVNMAFTQMVGYSRDDLAGANRFELLMEPADVEQFRERIAGLLRREIASFDMERRYSRADGSAIWVQGGTSLVEDGDDVYLHSIVLDITESKRNAEALREGESRLRDVLDALHEGLMVRDGSEVRYVNRAMLGLFTPLTGDIEPIDVLRSMDPIHTDGEPLDLETRPTVRVLTMGEPVLDQVIGFRIPGRGLRWMRVNVIPRIRGDEVIGTVSTFSDITESQDAIDALSASEKLLRTLTESLPIGMYQSDLEGHLSYVNPRWCEIMGIDASEAVGMVMTGSVHPDDVEEMIGVFRRIRETGEIGDCRYRLINRRGEPLWLHAYGARTVDAETGEPNGFIGSIDDVTDFVRSEQQRNQLANIIEQTSDLVGITNAHTFKSSYLNKASRELLGFLDTDLVDLDVISMYTPEAQQKFTDVVTPELNRNGTWSGELDMLAADGSTIHVWQTITAQVDPEGNVVEWAAMGRDISERRRMEQELAHKATHDSLTGLPNRTSLIEDLGSALERTQCSDQMVALIFLDIDRFKAINDSLGHDAGDEFLCRVSSRIEAVLRGSDTVARLGGDEFVILIHDFSEEDHAVDLARRVLAAIESEPFVIHGTELRITASAGIAISTGASTEHAEVLLRDADAAMYRAKEKGRARFELYDESMRKLSAIRLERAEQLGHALSDGQIELHYQPCVDLSTNAVVCVEGLARWRHPERGLVPPGEFIDIAEESGLIIELGLRVLELACEQGRIWELRFGDMAPRIHVNVSPRQFASGVLPSQVHRVLDRSRLSPGHLCIEITESTLMEDASSATRLLGALKDLGVAIAIDDFGTGYSSLSYLSRFPIDVLKIDRSFVDGLDAQEDRGDSAIVASIVGLAASLQLESIAEGVETEVQLDFLRDIGCRSAQGYLFARPTPPAQLTELLEAGLLEAGLLGAGLPSATAS